MEDDGRNRAYYEDALREALTISPEQLEAAARAIYEIAPFTEQANDPDGRPLGPEFRITWEQAQEFPHDLEGFYEEARAAFTAAGFNLGDQP